MRLSFTIEHRGKWRRYEVEIAQREGRIWFTEAPFAVKDEIKAMQGARWHPDLSLWSIADSPRNWFQLKALNGEPVYAHFDQPLVQRTYRHPLMPHQRDLADRGLTYHYQIWAAEMGTGKTLSAQMVIECSGVLRPWWVGPKSSIKNIQRELRKWGYTGPEIRFTTYEALKELVQHWGAEHIPDLIIFDESSKLKNHDAHRSQAAQWLADEVRRVHGMAGYVILMSGTPSPKTPLDWWSQAEICWPGYLREGSAKQLEKRLGILAEQQYSALVFKKRIGWQDQENKCTQCGAADRPSCACGNYTASRNEVAYLYERLKGLVVIKHKKECLDLPEKQYRVIECEPTASTLRVADVICRTSPSAVQALTQLRELSDGFLYREENGTRVTKQVPCPKDQALRDLLDENEDTGRIVIFAGFTGSVDRIAALCLKAGWDVVRCDGRGMHVLLPKGQLDTEPLDYWADRRVAKVAFVAHPESGGMSLTLTESSMAVFYSNSFKPEYRAQAEDRIHRAGMDANRAAVIVDLLHLPQDQKVLDTLRANRRLELMTLGELQYGCAA